MALHRLIKPIIFNANQEREIQIISSLLCNHFKKHYSQDNKKITHIPQNPEDCGCSNKLPKLKSKKSKQQQKQPKKEECAEEEDSKDYEESNQKDTCPEQPPSKTTHKENECLIESEERCEDYEPTRKEKKSCYHQPPSTKACKKRKDYAEQQEEDCNQPKPKDRSKTKQEDCTKPKPKDCSESKPKDCTQPKEKECKPIEMDFVKPIPKTYLPDPSKIRQAHICNERARAKTGDTKILQKKSKVHSKDCHHGKKQNTVMASTKENECEKQELKKSGLKTEAKSECTSNKSTAFYCAKCITERKAAEMQSCSKSKGESQIPKTIDCKLGKKNKDIKPTCKQKEKESKSRSECVKEPLNLKEQKVRTINPCDPCAKPKGCNKDGKDDKNKTNWVKVLGIPAVILLIAGLIYEYCPSPEAPPSS